MMATNAIEMSEGHVYLLRVSQLERQIRVTFQCDGGTTRRGFATLEDALAFILTKETNRQKRQDETLLS